jgi:hypothetical protein
MVRFVLAILAFILIVGCSPIDSRTEYAKNALVEFFELLNQDNYQTAAELYGGDYSTLINMNPLVDPLDHATLWGNACHNNGFMCLKIHKATFRERTGNIYYFDVEFIQADGTLFSRGACCGENPKLFEAQETFLFRLINNEPNQYRVLDLPVYVP